MKFGIITPVFDGCLESLELLFREISSQTYKNWVWMLCSNGYSEKIHQFIKEKNKLLESDRNSRIHSLYSKLRPQIIYHYLKFEEVQDSFMLLSNIGKRRDYCIHKIRADYIFMIDADAKLLDDNMFKILNTEIGKNSKNICIYNIIHEIGLLPIFPIGYARIDMLNFCVKASVARKVGYPTTVNPEAAGNDYWYFDRALRASNGDFLFVDRVFGQHNGNNSYKNLCQLLSG